MAISNCEALPFRAAAPVYYRHNLPVIPLVPNGKRPAIKEWQRYATNNVPEEVQQSWLTEFPNGNIGLVMGLMSQMVALDVDVNDPSVDKLLAELLPSSPWKRVGAKGYILAFKYNDEKTFRIKDRSGKPLVELLSIRTQIVLPPSIHPETGNPYQANRELVEVIDHLNWLPGDVQGLLRGGLLQLGYDVELPRTTIIQGKLPEWVPVGSRDTTMVRVAGFYARKVLYGKSTLREVIDQYTSWHQGAIEDTGDDTPELVKGLANIGKFLCRDLENNPELLLKSNWDDKVTETEKRMYGFDSVPSLRVSVNPKTIVEKLDENSTSEEVNHAVKAIAREFPDEGSIEKDKLLSEIKGRTGIGITTLRKISKSLTLEPTRVVANATLGYYFDGGKRIAKRSEGGFWVHEGTHWRELTRDELEHRVEQTVQELGLSARQPAKFNSEVAKLIQQQLQEDQIINLAAMPNPVYNCVNGELWFDSDGNAELRGHQPKSYILSSPSICYDPNASCPITDTFLNRIFQDYEDRDEIIRFVYEFFGYLLTGDRSFHIVLFLWGKGATGKSTLLQIMQLLVGEDNCFPTSLKRLRENRFERAEFVGKLLVFDPDQASDATYPDDFLKTVAENGLMQGEKKYLTPFQFRNTAQFVASTNSVGYSKTTDSGYTRRLMVIPFNNIIPESERDGELIEKIKDEISGVLNKAIEGRKRLYSRGSFLAPKSMEEAKNDFINLQSSVHQFLAENYQVDENSEGILLSAVRTSFISWATMNDIPLPGRAKFEILVAEKFEIKGRTNRHRKLVQNIKKIEDSQDQQTISDKNIRGVVIRLPQT